MLILYQMLSIFHSTDHMEISLSLFDGTPWRLLDMADMQWEVINRFYLAAIKRRIH